MHTSIDPDRDAHRPARGLLITAGAVLLLTPETLLLRLLSLDPWTVVFWRGVLMGAALALGLALVYRGRTAAIFRAIGLAGISIGLLYGIQSLLFILALAHTSVANTLIMASATPLVAAVMGRVFLRERVRLATWLAIFAGMGGIAIVVSEGLGRGTWRGDLFALAVAFTMAGALVLMRHGRRTDMVPAAALGGFAAALLSGPMAAPFVVHGRDALLLAVIGLGILPASFAMLMAGVRHVPAPEVALILLLETVLAPLWVWFALGEAVRPATLIGGAVVVTTLIVHSAVRLRDER